VPRLPVDGKRVIEHRVSLSGFERQQIDTLITGLTVRNVGQPIIALLSDASALAALYILLNSLFPGWTKNLPGDWPAQTEGMTLTQINDWLEPQNLAGMAVGGIIGGVVGGPIGAGIGAGVGGVTVEAGEYVAQPGFVERMFLGLRLLIRQASTPGDEPNVWGEVL